jgi:selenocysteine-specific elongation factor
MAKDMQQHIVLGMAGHIDHGKTAIVKALTGTDTDRLKEEKERGMTTDLGFAFLGDDITIIDVPGHEKFVKTMVAGVNTIDLAVLVVAADDGIMPQTEEHLEILNLLHVSTGLVAVNKIDIVEPDWVELVIDDIRNLMKGTVLDGAPIIPVSAIENRGIDTLKEEILRVSGDVRARQDKGVFRLPVDRVFSIKGFGTVVAGTILSGTVAHEDTVELLPQSVPLRVRGVQVHDRPVDRATVGFRTAINLGKIEKESIERGDMLAEPGYFKPTYMIDAHFSLLKSWTRELKNQTRVRVHIGTNEIIARIILLDSDVYTPGDEGFVQLHFEKPVVADREDRFVIRSYSPIRTLGGGVILDTDPTKHRRLRDEVIDKLDKLLKGDPNQIVLEQFNRNRFMPQAREELTKSLGITKGELEKRIAALEENNQLKMVGKKRIMSAANYEMLQKRILNQVELFHNENPLRYTIAAGKLKQLIRPPADKNVFDEIIAAYKTDGTLTVEGDQVRLTSHAVDLSPHLVELKNKMIKQFDKAPFNPPKNEDLFSKFGENARKLLDYLVDSGELVMIDKGQCFHREGLAQAKKAISSLLTKGSGEASIGEMRECLEGMSRKKAVALLEYLDRTGFTVRVGDVRKLK